jgi:glycosyltransferase involved in cell wall biosynthesis
LLRLLHSSIVNALIAPVSGTSPRLNEGYELQASPRLDRPRVLIGPVFTDHVESVSLVNRAFVEGLGALVDFLPQEITRRFGHSQLGKINAANAFYAGQHLVQWLACLRKGRPDIAHYAVGSGWNLEKSLTFLAIARAHGCRVVGHVHSGNFVEYWHQLGSLRRKRALGEIRNLDALVASSEGWKHALVKCLGIPATKVFVVNNPLDPSFEVPALNFPHQRVGHTVLAFGVMGRAKGVFELVQAAEELARKLEFQLILAGPDREPDAAKKLRAEVLNRGLEKHVQVLGPVEHKQKLELFRRASIFVLPSHYENFPLVLLEAAAAGLALVSTPVGATPEFFKDQESALFVPPKSPASLAAALETLLRDQTKRELLASTARRTFQERLSRAPIMDSLYDVYCSVLHRPVPGRRAPMPQPSALG